MGPFKPDNLAAALAAGDSWIELWQTDFLLILDVILIILFFVETCRRVKGPDGWHLGTLLSDSPTKIIWALAINYLAKLIDRIWLLLRHYNAADEMLLAILAVLALLLAIWSAGCLLRVFSGVVWGKRAWIWIVGIATAGATIAMAAAELMPT